MRTTQQLRNAWAPACQPKGDVFREAYGALDAVLRRHGYRPKDGQTWGYNCRRITGGSGYSLHAYGPGGIFTFWSGTRVTMALAVDINSLANPYGPRLVTDMPMAMVEEIEAIRTNGGHRVWGWGGRYARNKDAMHIEVVASPAELATGIASTERTTPRFEEDFIMHGSIPPNSEVFECLDGVALNASGRQAYLRVTARDRAAQVYIGGFDGSPNGVVTIPNFVDGAWAVKVPRTANGFYLGSGPDNPEIAWVVTPSAA